MKTKKGFTFILFALIIFSSLELKSNNLQYKSNGDEIKKMLIEFYTSYIIENSKMPVDNDKINFIKRKYCTDNLIRKVKKQELDYDPILNAQDCDREWIKTLSVLKDSKKKNVYKISFKGVYNEKCNIVNVLVVKENNIYKIDNVW